MATESFPATLPQPEVSYGFGVETTTLRTKDRSGGLATRGRGGLRTHKIRVKWKLTDAELQTFETFFDTTLADGSKLFDITLPFGDGLKTNEATFFESAYQAVYIPHLNWEVTATLIVDEANEIDTYSDFADLMLSQSGTIYTAVLPLSQAFLTSEGYLKTGIAEKLDLSLAELSSDDYAYDSDAWLDLSTATLTDDP